MSGGLSNGPTNPTGQTKPVDPGLEGDGGRVAVTAAAPEMSIVRRLPADNAENGAAVVAAGRLAGVLGSLAGARVEAALDGGSIRLTSGGFECGFPADAPNAEWDDRRSALNGLGAPVPLAAAAALVGAFAQVVCAASGTARPGALAGIAAVHLSARNGRLCLAATDSYRLAVRECPAAPGSLQDPLLIPIGAANEIARLPAGGDQAAARIGAGWAAIDVGPNTVAAKLSDGDFPCYEELMGATLPTRSTAARSALLEALAGVASVMADDHHEVSLELAPGFVRVSAAATGPVTATATAPASHSGPPLVAVLDSGFLRDGIEHLPGPETAFAAADPQSALRIGGPGPEDGVYLLMPFRQ